MKLSAYHQSLREKLLPGDVQAYVDGTSASRIAQARGMSLNTVLRRLREAQVEIRPAGTRPAIVLDLTDRFHEIIDVYLDIWRSKTTICCGKPEMDLAYPVRTTASDWVTIPSEAGGPITLHILKTETCPLACVLAAIGAAGA